MPDIVETLGDDLNACYIGDFLTGIPMMKERGNAIGICTNKAITDELGFSEDDFNITTEDYSTYEQLDALFAAVKEAYPDMQPAGRHQHHGKHGQQLCRYPRQQLWRPC